MNAFICLDSGKVLINRKLGEADAVGCILSFTGREPCLGLSLDRLNA